MDKSLFQLWKRLPPNRLPTLPACTKISQAEQIAFSLKVIEQLGYDFQRGQQDKTRHPFMTKFSTGDDAHHHRVRENDLNEGLFSTIHEMGHALLRHQQRI